MIERKKKSQQNHNRLYYFGRKAYIIRSETNGVSPQTNQSVTSKILETVTDVYFEKTVVLRTWGSLRKRLIVAGRSRPLLFF